MRCRTSVALVSVSTASFTGSSGATNIASSCRTPATACSIPRDPGAVTNDPSAVIRTPGQRSRCGAPHRARLIVPQVEGFPRRIGQRIVGERRQPVLAAVAGPGERGPGAAHDRAERGIRQHVRPWQRRFAFAVEHDDVLAPVAREAAEPVLHDQRRDRHRCGARSRRLECGRARNVMLVVQPGGRPLQLRHQIAEIAGQDDLGHGGQEASVRLGHPVSAQQERASWLSRASRPMAAPARGWTAGSASRRDSPPDARSG